VEVLSALKSAFSASHQFWPDDLSLTDASIFDSALIAGSRQVTDAYLLGLAVRHKAALVSFDRSLPWHAIRKGSARLIQSPA
jgi:predicted nucleic acid-binding protein